MRCKLLIAVFLLGAAAGANGQDTKDVTAVTHLLSRATFGVRSADVAYVQKIGIDRWLDEQMQPDRIDDSAVEKKLARFDALHLSIPELAEKYTPAKQKPAVRHALDSLRALGVQPTQEQIRAIAGANGAVNSPRRLLGELVSAKLLRAADSNRQLEEVMTDFWFNHFNVFFADGAVRYLVADYEKNAIRPYVFGKFYDMLHATATHPAMLVYLNNAMSTVPDSLNPMAARFASNKNVKRRPSGLNENYARELMELHTLGVDAGYTQHDVIEVARAFTGWTVLRPRRAGDANAMNGMSQTQNGFRFAPFLHDRGEKVVLGQHLPAGRGMQDGEDVLRMLARSPATAHHIARQLIQHFVTDDPPADFVNELADVFLKTDGDLGAVTKALFTSRHFYDAKYVRTKVKTPFELVASALRVTDADFTASPALLQTLRSLGELPYMEQAPTGYPAASADWVNSGAMLSRMNFAIALANGATRGVRVGVPDNDVASIVSDVLPNVAVAARRAQIEKDAGSDMRRALGFALGSPEFQVK